jgi:hypothetical protein
MKKLLLGILGAALLAVQASAVPILVLGAGDFPARDIDLITGNSGLGDQNVEDWLVAEAAMNGFPAPTLAQSDYTGGPVLAGDYLVLHYGAGPGGTPQGGLVIVYFDADQASYAVPATGSGPNGNGGISFARLFDHTVPDGGATLMLLSLGMLGLSSMARFKKNA